MIKVEGNTCVNAWVYGEDWIPKAYDLLWSATVGLAVVLMAGLYSRIVYTLWFKRDHDLDNEVTFQQRVSIKNNNFSACFFASSFHVSCLQASRFSCYYI